MIPVVILKLDEFPRLPSGKINRKVLPFPKSFEKLDESDTKEINLKASLKKRVIDTLTKVIPPIAIGIAFVKTNSQFYLPIDRYSSAHSAGGH